MVSRARAGHQRTVPRIGVPVGSLTVSASAFRRHSRTPVDAPALSALRSVAAGLGLSRCWHGSDRIVSLDAGERSDQRRAAQTPFEPPVVFVAGVIAIPLSQAPLGL